MSNYLTNLHLFSCHFQASQLKEIDTRPKTPSIKFEKKTKDVYPKPREANMDESNALKNWQMKMMERKRQQGYISSE